MPHLTLSPPLLLLLLSSLLTTTHALPNALPAPGPSPPSPEHPLITPPPTLVPRDPTPVDKRGIDIGSYVGSVLGGIGSAIPSYVASGIPNFFQDFPTGTAVLSRLGISDGDLAARPTEVLNLPGYANWTDQGWNLLVHGNVYKQPNISQSKLDDLANVFLIGTSIKDLPADQQAQARNLTAEIFVVQQSHVNVTFSMVPNVPAPSGLAGGLVPAKGGAQEIVFPEETTDQGDFARFIPLKNTSSSGTGSSNSGGGFLTPGNLTANIQALNYYATNTTTGNATAYLVPPVGFTVISDIDDILRVTKIYKPSEGLLNSFARPFTPWLNMPSIYANLSASIPDLHFHYLTTTPEQATRNYMEYIYKTYPLGSFDTRPLNFSDVAATLSIRKFLLTRIFETYPKRKFVLVADTSNSDVMRDYPALVTDFPGQVLCIWLRNTSSTDADDKFPYDTSGFQGVSNSSYMFFNVPDDLKGLDVMGGECRNKSVLQNVTFAYQGLPFGAGVGLKAGAGTLALALVMGMAVVMFGEL